MEPEWKKYDPDVPFDSRPMRQLAGDVFATTEATEIAWSYLEGHLDRREAVDKLAALGANRDEADDFLTAEAFEAQAD